MNLVSYEYVACQEATNGVLVLSEFTGAAQALGAGCIRVNPYNIEELARGIGDAIAMPPHQRAELHKYASQYVAKFTSQVCPLAPPRTHPPSCMPLTVRAADSTSQAWAQGFVSSLEEADDSEELRGSQPSEGYPLPLHDVVARYSNATRRLLVFGVGGTFLPATGATANDDAQLSPEQRQLLAQLLADPANTVVLSSGRSRAKMDELAASFMPMVPNARGAKARDSARQKTIEEMYAQPPLELAEHPDAPKRAPLHVSPPAMLGSVYTGTHR